MQHLYNDSEERSAFTDCPLYFKPRSGSSRCLELSHMLHRLCGPPSIPLSFSLAAVVPRRSTYRVSFDTEGTKSPHIKLTTFTAWTTRVSNPVCYPRFRLSESVSVQQAAFALGVLPNIYAFHRYTWYSAYLSSTLVHQSSRQFRS